MSISNIIKGFDFQRGLDHLGGSTANFERGIDNLLGASPHSKSSKSKLTKRSNYKITYPDRVALFKALEMYEPGGMDFLYRQPCFYCSNPNELTKQTILSKFDYMYLRKRERDGTYRIKDTDPPPTKEGIDDLLVEDVGSVVTAFNLPGVNWFLAGWCEAHYSTREEPLPPIHAVAQYLHQMGICITPEYTASLGYSKGGPPVKNFIITGPTDMYNIFGAEQINELPKRLKPGSQCYFVIHAEKVFEDYETYKDLKFKIGGNSSLTVHYTKPYVWVMSPKAMPVGNWPDLLEEPITIRSVWRQTHFNRMPKKPAHYLGDDSDDEEELVAPTAAASTHKITLTGFIYRFGYINGWPAPGKLIPVSGDVRFDVTVIQRLPVVEVCQSFIQPPGRMV